MQSYLAAAFPTITLLLPAMVLVGAQRVAQDPTAVVTAVAVAVADGVVADAGTSAVHRSERELRLVVATDGNEARYRVREQLAGIEFPSDAVGVTSAVSGSIVIGDDGSIVSDQSKFVVDLTGLTSDNERRDRYIQRRTMETEQHPNAEFVPTSVTGLTSPLPTAGDFTMVVTGDMTVHGVTKAITWDVTARAADGGYTGTAATAFTFEDFGMTKPRVARVLSVVDTIRLEYDFKLMAAH